VVVVLGHEAEAVGEALSGLAVRRVKNPAFERGQSTSVRAGLAALGAGRLAAMFLLADQPLLEAATIDRLIAAWEETGGPIVVPVDRGSWGSPVLFDRALFGELGELRGDAGGRRILPRHAGSIVAVEVGDRRQLLDVDTPEDLRRLEEMVLRATA
jgi:molybdenum cofactor cytidylyltransferase